MKTRHISAGLLAACAIAASATPAFGDSAGTVLAQVTVAAPCILVTPAQFDYGTLGFSQSDSSTVFAGRVVSLTNCATALQEVLGRGTNATSTAGTTWTLEADVPLCATPNRFQLKVAGVSLSAQDTSVLNLSGGQTATTNAFLTMPCTGSGGAGQVMTFSYVFTAALG